MIALLKALKDGWIVGRVADGKVEEAELANARIWPDFPCLISLYIFVSVPMKGGKGAYDCVDMLFYFV